MLLSTLQTTLRPQFSQAIRSKATIPAVTLSALCSSHNVRAVQPVQGSALRYSRKFSSWNSPMRFEYRSASPPMAVRDLRHRAVIALGSNVGDKIRNIELALQTMKDRGLRILKTSPLYETKPMYHLNQDNFINGVCQVATDLEPLSLLDVLQGIENSLGRERTISKGPRTIDLDIVVYNQQFIKLDRLEVPHKLMLEREFVLRPLVDMLPSQTLPIEFTRTSHKTYVAKHLQKLEFKDPLMSKVTVIANNLPLWRASDSDTRTRIMAILNLTPDSFSDGGKHAPTELNTIKDTVRGLIAAGATIVDVGGQSTRPQAELIRPEEELQRILPVIRAIREMPEAEPIAISVDTFYAEVARKAVEAGADLINDVSAGLYDPDMLSTVAEVGATIILMHLRGTPKTMSQMTDYPDGLLKDVAGALSQRVKAAREAGIYPWRVIIDPGIGFAKTQAQNLELLRSFSELQRFPEYNLIIQDLPWLIGPSRKGFIGHITGVKKANERKWGTAAAVTASIQQGAAIVRVHDVHEMAQVAKMADAIYRG